MNIVIVGKAGSGKTTVAEYLCDDFRYRRSIDATTRPQRLSEQNGREYFFVDDKVFDICSDDGCFIAEEEFNGWKYGAVDHKTGDNWVYVSDPSRLAQMNDSDMEFISFYIDDSYMSRCARQVERGDSLEEIRRRKKTDDEDFEDIEYLVSVVIDGRNKSCWDIVDEILHYVERYNSILNMLTGVWSM